MAFTSSLTGKTSYSNEKIIFNQVLTSEGGAYDGSTGVFTCPSNGVYAFTWTVMTYYGRGACKVHLSINGTTQTLAAYASLAGISKSAHSQSTMTRTVRLSAGDRVWVYSTSCAYLYESPFSAFSGWKL